MPIHINLLAEAKIAEEMRRRDPVKRAIFVGLFLVALAFVWSSTLQLDAMVSKNRLGQLQAEITSHSNAWQNVMVNQTKLNNAKANLDALQRLSAARFLQGNFLNALQQLNMDSLQMARIKELQNYDVTPGTANRTNSAGTVIPGRPGTVSEKIVLSFDVRDFSASPGGQVNKFKDTIATNPYFKTVINKTDGIQLINLSPPQSWVDGRPYVLFTLETKLPDQIR
jgi:hypothetical protein